MTLRTSSTKLNPALNMFKFTVRKNIGIIALITIFMLLGCPGYVILKINRDITPAMSVPYNLDKITILIAVFVTIFTSALAVLSSFINLSFMYTKRSSDVYHSFPLTRTELLLSRYFASVVPLLIPITLCYSSLAAITLMRDVTGNIKTILLSFMFNVLIMIMCSAFSVIFIICAGSTFNLILSFFGINLGFILMVLIVTALCQSYLVGYSNSINYSLLNFSPFYFAFYKLSIFLQTAPDFGKREIIFILELIILMVVFLLIAVMLYNRRKSEKSGEAYAYKFIYIICSFVVSFVGAFALGSIFSYGEYNIIFWSFAVCGAVLTAITFCAITEKGFKNLKKSIIVGVSSMLFMGLISVTLFLGGFGFNTRLPNEKSIQSVSIRFNNDDISFKNPELVLDLHKSIIKNIDNLKSEADDHIWSYIYIDYTLENGKTMSRQYLVENEYFKNELLEIYKSDEKINWLKEQVDKMMPSSIILYNFNPIDNSGVNSIALSSQQLENLISVYSSELKKATFDSLFAYYDNEKYETGKYQINGTDSDKGYLSVTIFAEDSFTETKALLDSFNWTQEDTKN